MKKTTTLIVSLLLSTLMYAQTYTSKTGNVSFSSDAPAELINAESKKMVGILKAKENTFAFSIKMTSFQGFNSELQREHFNENYVESDKFPKATFTGKIIDNIDFTKDGTYKVTAKGKLTIHGKIQERSIPATITTKDGKVSIYSKFTVKLVDHDIERPTLVLKKIAEEIYITVNMPVTKK